MTIRANGTVFGTVGHAAHIHYRRRRGDASKQAIPTAHVVLHYDLVCVANFRFRELENLSADPNPHQVRRPDPGCPRSFWSDQRPLIQSVNQAFLLKSEHLQLRTEQAPGNGARKHTCPAVGAPAFGGGGSCGSRERRDAAGAARRFALDEQFFPRVDRRKRKPEPAGAGGHFEQLRPNHPEPSPAAPAP